MQLTLLPDQKTMYQALVDKDSSFEGVFVAAIKTTGIFCRPTCTARKPKEENVEYYPDPTAAIHHGYRPCKVCDPMNAVGQLPTWLEPLMKEIKENTGIKINDQGLRERGLDPARVRRWFKRYHGMTFQAYLRSLRLNAAFGQIREGDAVIRSAYENGFDSLSAFVESFKKTTGFSPNQSKSNTVISITRISTPLGPMLAGAVDEGICLLEFTDRRMLETQLTRLSKYLSASFVPGQSPHFSLLEAELGEYFDGKRKDFSVPLVVPGSDFQKSVWQALQNIPYGETRSYLEQANAVGNKKAIRAVARANGDNRVAIIIPCHRVIGSDGQMTGYGGGIWRKQWMIAMEGRSKS